MRTDLTGRPTALRVAGTVKGTPPIYGVVAYFDSLHDGGYQAPAATSVPDADGRFAIEISDLAQCGNGEIRIEFCHANGAVSERWLGFAATSQGLVDLSQWQMRQGLEPVAKAVETGQLNDALAALAELEKSESSGREKLIGRKLVDTLRMEPKSFSSAVPLDITNVMLGDTQPSLSSVGWLAPAANRIPSNSQIDSPLLDCGTLFATGFSPIAPHDTCLIWAVNGSSCAAKPACTRLRYRAPPVWLFVSPEMEKRSIAPATFAARKKRNTTSMSPAFRLWN